MHHTDLHVCRTSAGAVRQEQVVRGSYCGAATAAAALAQSLPSAWGLRCTGMCGWVSVCLSECLQDIVLYLRAGQQSQTNTDGNRNNYASMYAWAPNRAILDECFKPVCGHCWQKQRAWCPAECETERFSLYQAILSHSGSSTQGDKKMTSSLVESLGNNSVPIYIAAMNRKHSLYKYRKA